MTSLNKNTRMQKIIDQLQLSFPDLQYRAGKQFYWSPDTNEIIYKLDSENEHSIWSLLHETGHALLMHQSYKADYELIKLEIQAWDRAKQLADSLKVNISEEHVQDCLDTYRDWIYRRSICPNCTAKSLQQGDFIHYRCFNCHTTWQVTTSRFCRSYRKTKNIAAVKSFYTH
jgi:hypothetical protein